MESIIIFYDNALIYSSNIFFILLSLLVIFTLLLVVNMLNLFIISTRYIIEINKRGKKTENNRIKSMIKAKLTIKIVSNIFMSFNKKKIKIISHLRRIEKKIKKEVLAEEENRI